MVVVAVYVIIQAQMLVVELAAMAVAAVELMAEQVLLEVLILVAVVVLEPRGELAVVVL